MPRAQREAQILDIAEQVFAERGYQGTTMEEIAERVGVTKPLIYEYFGSKEGLLSSCIQRARTQLGNSTMEAVVEVGEDATVQDVLRAGIRTFFEFMEGHATAFVLLQQEGAIASEASGLIEEIRDQQSKVTAEALRQAPALAAVPDELLEGYSEMIIGACERISVWRTRRPEMTSEQATDLVMSVMWDGVSGITNGESPD